MSSAASAAGITDRNETRMTAYYIASPEELFDAEGMREYLEKSPPVMESFGGRYLISEGHAETLAGDWRPPFLVLIEFPTMERLKAWYESPEYRPWRELRERSSRASIVVTGS
jgi:uncharacterized protein (DUF1330 family)